MDVRWNEDLQYLGEANYDDDGYLLDVKMEKEEIEQFSDFSCNNHIATLKTYLVNYDYYTLDSVKYKA